MAHDKNQTELQLEDKKHAQKEGPVECLGKTFPNDNERRNHFLKLLAEKLKDPEFRKIEGFPIGEDEDILALSDPPYYTACPNPWIADFIKCYGKPYDPNVPYRKEPFAADVSEGKKDPTYGVHSYHTKVPHKAIMRYILHYTEPGDIVFDGFCGTGMAGVAAQFCADEEKISDLGLNIINNDSEAGNEKGNSVKVGKRHAILSDLSPAASFIARGYTHPLSSGQYRSIIANAIDKAESELGWIYQTKNPKTGKKEIVSYVIWSDIFSCPECGEDLNYWECAVDFSSSSIKETFPCQKCKSIVSKQSLAHIFENKYDVFLKRPIKVLRQLPVRICTINPEDDSVNIRTISKYDIDVIKKVEKADFTHWFPKNKMMFKDGVWGDQWRKGYHSDVTHDYHFFLKRSLLVLSAFANNTAGYWPGLFTLTGSMLGLSRMQRYTPDSGFPNMLRSGTLYIGSIHREWNAFSWIKGKSKSIGKHIAKSGRKMPALINVGSSTNIANIPASSIDYIFVDPPFGSNLAYSELNFIWEGWLKVFTNSKPEAIISKHQKKDISSYCTLMTRCFYEYYRVLKAGRWITVEFHNSQNSIWASLQEAIQAAGFVVADVRIIDKVQKGYNAINAAGAVNKDLVISAYKPNGGLEERFKLEAGTVEGVWDFIRTHLRQLPVFVAKESKSEIIAERQNFLLFDRMVAFHVQRGITVPLSASEFYQGLEQRFSERDSMFFLPEQAAEYDKKRMTVKEVEELSLFVVDESSAIQWLYKQLKEKSQTFQEMHPKFLQEIGGWQKHEKQLELLTLLKQNFLSYDGNGDVPNQIHAYLSTNFKELRNLGKDNAILVGKAKDRWYVPDPNKAGDIEKMREKDLLKEFWQYLPQGYKPKIADNLQITIPGLEEATRAPRGKKLKVIRMEAVRAGFKVCFENRDYKTIITIAQRIPEDVLQEDPKLLMWYDQAMTRMGEE